MLRKTLVVKQHGLAADVTTSNWRYFANARLLLRSILPRPDPNARPAESQNDLASRLHPTR
jgi:hypothetical protein